MLLLLAGALRPPGAASDTPMDQMVDPRLYRDLLAEYVVRLPLEGGGFETRFDYAAFHASPDQEAVRGILREIFLAVEPEALGEDARRAWAVNAYNFLVIDRVVESFLGADGDTLASIADVGEGSFAVFDDPAHEVGGHTYSLNDFEKHFLFLDVDRGSGSMPGRLDPRLHFALVCAAKGCPALWPEPFTAGELDDRLDAVTRNALSSPRQLRIDGDVVHVSQVFSWYAADFGGEYGVRGFLQEHAGIGERRVAADIEWDWSLNRP